MPLQKPTAVERLQRHDILYLKIASPSKIVASELGILPMMTMEYYDSNCHSLLEIAASELGLLPAMKVEDDGIYIMREDSAGFLILTYSFKRPSDCTKAQLEDLASQILKQQRVDDEFLINNGFKREYGAIASMRKSVPISPPLLLISSKTRQTHSQRNWVIPLRLSKLSKYFREH